MKNERAEHLIIFLLGIICGVILCAALLSWLFLVVKVPVTDTIIQAVRSTPTDPNLFLSAY